MNARGLVPGDASSTDETVDTSAPVSSEPVRRGPVLALVDGRTPRLSGETEVLLRTRLRAAAVLLFLGFGVFLMRRPFVAKGPLPVLHVVVVAVLGAWAMPLCSRCTLTLKWLRVGELIIFGLPGLFFALFEFASLKAVAPPDGKLWAVGVVKSAAMHWFALIVLYGMFVPNNWRRTAMIVGPMALVPVLVTLYARQVNETVASVIDVSIRTELFLMVSLAAVCATYGAHIVHSLRREAFEAKQFGQYRLGKLIGAGGMGEVYLAEHQLLKRPCAIKVIRPGKAADPHALTRFEREVRATAGLTHWNSVEVYDYGRTDDGTFYYVMEYLPGLSLTEIVERYGPMEPARVVHLIDQTCNALREAHVAGLVHRDIKPSNIFAAQRGGVYDVAKLLDFGLVKPAAKSPSLQVTQEGAITGSPLYMSPEQAAGDAEPDPRSDLYSLGAVAYHAITGRPPFDADNPVRVLIAHARDAVVPPTELGAAISPELEQVVLRCLAKDPDERFADVQSLQSALAQCKEAGRWTDEDAAAWWQHRGMAAETAPAAL